MPCGMLSCRNAAVLEKTSARKRADALSGASAVIGIVRVAVPPLPSETVSTALNVPAAV